MKARRAPDGGPKDRTARSGRLLIGWGVAALACLFLAASSPPVKSDTPAKAPAQAKTAAPAKPGAKTPIPDKTTAQPDSASAAKSTPGAKEIRQLSFLSGKWQGKIDSFPFKMDITIKGSVEKPDEVMKFDIDAEPTSTARFGIEGKYLSRMTYSEKLNGIRAIVVDNEGRGIEMVGARSTEAPEWHFDSTPDGAPFPFKVRLIPVTSDQIVVNYTSGGRMALKYEVTFNRVDS